VLIRQLADPDVNKERLCYAFVTRTPRRSSGRQPSEKAVVSVGVGNEWVLEFYKSFGLLPYSSFDEPSAIMTLEATSV
jgi:hypothetical protein